MLKNSLFKIVFILLFFVVAFHAVGAEMVFCEDGAYAKVTDHGCQMCQPGHHSVTLLPTASFSGFLLSEGFVSTDLPRIRLESPSFAFFRPPISL